MKKLLISLVLVFLVSGFTFAQANKNWDGTKPEVYQFSKGFVFTYSPFQSNLGSVPAGYYSDITGENTLVSTPLYGVGFKFFATNIISITAGVHFGTGSTNGVDSNSTDRSTTQFGVSLDGDYHFKSLYGVSPYLGVNINYGSNNFSSTTKTAISTKTKWTGSQFGAGINFGFDWYFTAGLALGGKYTLGFASLSAPERTVGSQTPVKYDDGSMFGTGLGQFNLTVHF